MDFSKPIQTRCGYPVRILCTDCKDEEFPVVGYVVVGYQELLMSWTADGSCHTGRTDDFDLIQVSQPRKHAELIKRWAEDDSMRVKFKSAGTLWTESTDPTFGSTWDYEEILPGDPLY